MILIKDSIPDYIKALPNATDDQLVHVLKIAMSKDKDKKDWKKFEEVIQKERKKRGVVKTISAKGLGITSGTAKRDDDDNEDDTTADADDY